jgi:hypothetical protein
VRSDVGLVDPQPFEWGAVAWVEVECLGEVGQRVGSGVRTHHGASIVDGQVAGRDHTTQWAAGEPERKTIAELGL